LVANFLFPGTVYLIRKYFRCKNREFSKLSLEFVTGIQKGYTLMPYSTWTSSMRRRILLAILTFFLFSLPAAAQPDPDEAVAWLQAFLGVDTINPPGNEFRAVDFYGKIFDAEGVDWQSAESAPGRGNIWARLKGGDEPPLILLQHTDVVPANPKYWTTDALTGERRDGFIWGRGALDMKGTGISQLATFLGLHRTGLPLNRDVIFLATADEEAGGEFGVGWLVKNRPEIFAGAGLLLNEGGGGTRREGVLSFVVEVTQKVPVWLRLTAVDAPGHGSAPRPTSSVTRLLTALNQLHNNPFPPRIVPAVDTMFSGMAVNAAPPMAVALANMTEAVKQPGFVTQLQADSARLHALTRDTCSITRLTGSSKINVIPAEAWAEVDCRILPDRPVAEFIEEFKEVIAGNGVEVELILAFSPAVSSTDTRLYRAIENFAATNYPQAQVIPSVAAGFTDSHFTRDLGIASYGFSPRITEEKEFSRVHGNDERVSEAAFRRGVVDMHDVVRRVVYD
jgi:acetylornithine deacetylase/succinyl-diaminopimelate desuccinylase-like protein